MSTPAQTTEPKTAVAASLAPWVDLLSKSTAGVAIAIYASGFLIVSLFQSKYGFIGTSPFRARILAAGAWFFLFAAIPVATVVSFRIKHGPVSWMQCAQYLYIYYIGCTFLSFPAKMIFRPSDSSSAGGASWEWILTGLALLAVLVFLIGLERFPWVSATASVLYVVILVQFAIRNLVLRHSFQQDAITLWLFGIGVVTLVELKVRSTESMAQGDWAKTLFVILAALFAFAWFYYPNIEPSWGGGAPAEVTLYLSNSSVIKPSQAVSVQLVDESEAGFYIVAPGDKAGIYIPRSTVSLVYFSDHASESVLLRDHK
jgi:hypothetical protein